MRAVKPPGVSARQRFGMSFQKVVAGHVQCSNEVVQAGVHIDSLSVIGLAARTPSTSNPTRHTSHITRESLIELAMTAVPKKQGGQHINYRNSGDIRNRECRVDHPSNDRAGSRGTMHS